jgi:hypothetical protein
MQDHAHGLMALCRVLSDDLPSSITRLKYLTGVPVKGRVVMAISDCRDRPESCTKHAQTAAPRDPPPRREVLQRAGGRPVVQQVLWGKERQGLLVAQVDLGGRVDGGGEGVGGNGSDYLQNECSWQLCLSMRIHCCVCKTSDTRRLLPPSPPHLPPQQVEVLRRRRGVDHKHVGAALGVAAHPLQHEALPDGARDLSSKG